MIELNERAFFLNRIHLFNGFKEDQLAAIGENLEELEVPAGTVVFTIGARPDGFYLIFKGRVKVSKPREGKEDFLAWLTAGDYFGEEALLENRNRNATITALEDCLLFFVRREAFDRLLLTYPKLKSNFYVATKSRRLARSMRFKWLGQNEVIYFIARRHIVRLYQALAGPVLSLSLPLGLFAWGWMTGATTPYAIGVLSILAIAAWSIWNWIDWSNDFYIVTNQRVIWLEKVIGLYDSRQEAPLGTILSVGIETDLIGRTFDYGNVIVRTFVGRLEFDHVDHPAQAADMIREYWDRTKTGDQLSQRELMRDSIREKLGLPVERKPAEDLPPLVMENQASVKGPLWLTALTDLFKLRVQDGGTVLYRKHWIVFLQRAWKPAVFTLLGLGLMAARAWILLRSPERAFLQPNSQGALRPDTIMVALPLILLPFFGWFVWEYLDWKNDIFMVTQDEIIDIDKKPLGTEERRAAQIENILSTEYKREGLLGYLFNFGTVYISVGGSQLAFEDVLDPAGVQADINRRRMVRISRKSTESANLERERMAVWLAAYHQHVDEFDAPMIAPEEDEDEGIPG